jgi:hypothetical protein
MKSRYVAQAGYVDGLANYVAYSAQLNRAARGVLMDLSGQATGSILSTTNTLTMSQLCSQWAAALDQPLLANEVAQQIWYFIDGAIKNYYPNVRNIVIVGGDTIIPFYRIPDETDVANESTYYQELVAAGGFNPNYPVGGSLRYHFIQTDNFYGDRRPTPWRGRGLYLPDLAVGRLVETPLDIYTYLSPYVYVPTFPGPVLSPFTIRADRADAGHTGAAMVTGYDFLSDQAYKIAQRLRSYGFSPSGTLGTTYTLSLLNNDTWNLTDLSKLWFSNQLANFQNNYDGPQTKYQLMSLNAHFTHYSAIPADPASPEFMAQRIYTPTLSTGRNALGLYFQDTNQANNTFSSSLVWSVGCHSGLSMEDSSFSATPMLQADFPQATLKQGGNWIGNTGFGYGDTDTVGYSERLADLFTLAIGRDVRNRLNEYTGPTIGEALARAKQMYLRTSGPGGFSIYDEKVIAEMTLYGLPFIRVQVPKPYNPFLDNKGLPEKPPESVPTQTPQKPVLTRTITFTNFFDPRDVGGDVVYTVSSQVADSFSGQTIKIEARDQQRLGVPVLPMIPYDITLRPRPETEPPGAAALFLRPDQPYGNGPEPRGVRLVKARMLPDLYGFDPHVTSPISDILNVTQGQETRMGSLGEWMPDLPYTTQRMGENLANGTDVATDTLLVTPIQFRASDDQHGVVRRYAQMVFEITYVDPNLASGAQLNDDEAPIVNDAAKVPLVRALGGSQISSVVTDVGTGVAAVYALYTSDGISWTTVQMTPAGNDTYTAQVPSAIFAALVEAVDSAGNTTLQASKGTLAPALRSIYLPQIQRQ